MEFPVSGAQNAQQEINDSNYPMIRHFAVAKDISSTPKDDLKVGKWEVCNKATVGDFTAVGYFFAKKLYHELKIPIGIINTSWGGTCVETWTSREAFENSDEYKRMIAGMPNLNLDSISKTFNKSITDRIETIQGSKVSATNEATYKETAFNDLNWQELNVPGLWENQEFGDFDGVVWMRKSIVLSADDAKKGAILNLSKIDDEDVTYVNGIEVGKNTIWEAEREYTVPAGVLKEGVNVIAVRVVDNTGGGGIYGESSNLKLTIDDTVIPLDGKWKYKVVVVKSEITPNSYPSLLYNAMLNPLIPYAFQGVLWYQGEANVGRASQYKTAFPLMINDWRKKWNQGDFPFYFVQLASYNEFNGNSTNGSKWAELREAQTQTLYLTNTGMCVTTDIGNPKNIHPTNKQDVGKRLSAIALHDIYNKNIVSGGPTFKSMEIKDNQVIVTFDNVGGGLVTPDKYGYVKGFEIAGVDKVFYYAKAYINNNKVIVFNENVKSPVAIHFGWADDASDSNLYNKEEFPASPFRTDGWKMVTATEKYKF